MYTHIHTRTSTRALSDRLDSQVKMHMVTKNMSSITKSLEQSVQSNNLDKITRTMDQFEKQFENLDMQVRVCMCGCG
jgi:charged multivesicular body protein 1